jgi:hypothetical protein
MCTPRHYGKDISGTCFGTTIHRLGIGGFICLLDSNESVSRKLVTTVGVAFDFADVPGLCFDFLGGMVTFSHNEVQDW